VDGIAVNSIRRPDSSIYSELNKLTVGHFEIGKPDKKKKRMFADPSGSDLVSAKYGTVSLGFPPSETQPEEMVEETTDDSPEVAQESPQLNAPLYHNGGLVGQPMQEVSTMDGQVTYYTTTGQGVGVDFDISNAEDATEPDDENH
jgi:hypothetical protein